MGPRGRRLGRTGAALGAYLLLAGTAAACSVGEDAVVTIFTPETDDEVADLRRTLDLVTEGTGIRVEVERSDDFNREVKARIAAGSPPDIALFPQPGEVAEHREALVPLSTLSELSDGPGDDVLLLTKQNFDERFTELVTIGDEIMAIPVKTDLKSLIWYSPAVFAENGYDVPERFEDFVPLPGHERDEDSLTLAEQMIADGNPPFCIGIESGEASGWPGTDWVEDFMLRMHGPELYDRWWQHQIPFDDPRVIEVGEAVTGLWSMDGFVYGGTNAAAATNFADAGLPVLTGECMMYRQANFYGVSWPDGTVLQPCRNDDGSTLDTCRDDPRIVDAFVLPGSEEHPDVVLSGGLHAAALSDGRDVVRLMELIASTDFANAQAGRKGSLSPNGNIDASRYPDELTRELHERLMAPGTVKRFDASDQMPAAVGTGTFWNAMVDITLGTKTVAEAFTDVQRTWPDDGQGPPTQGTDLMP